MNEMNEKRPYPCDAPKEERRSYPCDVQAEGKRAYPCDTEPVRKNTYPCDAGETERRGGYPCDAEMPERRSGYPCDAEVAEEKKPADVCRTVEGGRVMAAGKGKRGGNAAASVVKRSGKAPQHPDYTKDRYQVRAEREAAERERRSAFRRDGEERKERFERSGGRDENGRFRREDENRGDRFRDRDRKPFDRRPRDFAYDEKRRENRDGKHFVTEPDYAKPHVLRVVQNTEIGSFLALSEEKRVLLPFAEQTVRPKVGDEQTVYLYEDKGGRMTATMRKPILKDGELGILKVAEVTKIGLFLDNGVPKQILVPFREQVYTPREGDDVLVYIYRDKSGRQAATMRVYKYLDNHSPYEANDKVRGFIYEVNPKLGIFVAVDNRYFGMIPVTEVFQKFRYGEIVETRVLRVREDGKLDLSAREKSYVSLEPDAEVVLYEIKRQGGVLPYADKADAAFIEETYAMSKNQFKRALGHLFKQKKIMIDRENDRITLIEE